jgi:dolichol-phosphate mannosyltransferase
MRILVLAPAFNEKGKIGKTVASVPRGVVDEMLVIDDASTDTTADEARAAGATVIRHAQRAGVGAVIREAICYGRSHGFDILVVMAGNSKDDGAEIPVLTAPIIEGRADFVQGKMPLYRRLATRMVHPVLFSWFAGQHITDSTNGFRAIRLSIFDDARIAIGQAWLDHYELEPYIFFKAIRLKYRVMEAPVHKIYPDRKLGYTKMRPFVDWW